MRRVTLPFSVVALFCSFGLVASCGSDSNQDLLTPVGSGGIDGGSEGSQGGSGGGAVGGSGGAQAGSGGGLQGGSGGIASGGTAGTATGGTAGTATGGTAGTATGGTAGTAGSASNPPPTIGVEFWAVDLPNERGGLTPSEAPVLKPWGVFLVNPGEVPATVKIEQNNAPIGQPLSLSVTTTVDVQPHSTQKVLLPTREVTGWTPTTPDPPGPPMTFLSSNAFRVTSSAPISVVQLNTMDSAFSSDGSLLLPTASLAGTYHVLSYQSANPVAVGPAFAGIPDHSSITIVGVTANTLVKVIAAAPLLGDGASIPKTSKGGTLTVSLGPFDVLNVASDGATGDLSGTVVEASAPVAVFTSVERAMVPEGTPPTPPPGYDPNSLCCTEHVEEQVRPDALAGSSFALAHSPYRSTGTYKEPDLVRVLGLGTAAQVSTNLAAPLDSFALEPGEVRDLWLWSDAVITSTAPIGVGQMLVSEAFTTVQTLGDPSLVVIPPLQDHRRDVTFPVLEGWSEYHITITTPTGNALTLDGAALPAACAAATAGTIGSVEYEAIRCPVVQGTHRIQGTLPYGLVVYGYGVGSAYSFATAGL